MLDVCHLRKEYNDLEAVKDISFSLGPGDIFGFIGSNGAGKTTTIRMIATLLEPTAGTAVLNGVDVREDPMAIRRMLGYMPDFFGLYDDVKVYEYLDFFASLYEVPARRRPGVIHDCLTMTNLSGKRDAFVQSLSRGMQQRLCLARCLVHDPSLLLLDEPASGLDPRARAELKELILELGKSGKIIIVSSHILPELADFCNTVGIIEKGELLAFGPVDEVVRNHRPARILEIKLIDRAPGAARLLAKMTGVLDAQAAGEDEVRMDFNGDLQAQAELVRALVADGYQMLGLKEDHADLEDVFLKLTKGAVN
ncbi:MAG TPA: ABC transporter ATP-binding protein [Fimbriimonas sp.]|nr:ABC transporter ATP-binding protein [Fimbriimonas sp.]